MRNKQKIINKYLKRLDRPQLYRCSVPCDDWECYHNGEHVFDEEQCSTENNKCEIYPTAKCVPIKENSKVVLKSEKPKRNNTEDEGDL